MKTFFSIIALFAGLAVADAGWGKPSAYADISLGSLKQSMARGTVTLIDVNGTRRYEKGHIPGAVNFQACKDDLLAVLPKDRDALIVAYCANVHCGAYVQATKMAADLGFTNVAHFSGGIEGWMDAGEEVEKN